jgi:Fe-S cluster biogenesis protein NfuA
MHFLSTAVLLVAVVDLLLAGQSPVTAFAPRVARPATCHARRIRSQIALAVVRDESSPSEASLPPAAAPPPAILNGKRVLPAAIIKAGLKGQDSRIAGVYALLSDYQKGSEGWESVVHVGVSQDIKATLDAVNVAFGHVRALSFSFPQPNAMQDVANDWSKTASDAGATLQEGVVDASSFLFDDDDDDDFDDDDWSMGMTAQAVASVPSSASSADADIVSPFQSGDEGRTSSSSGSSSTIETDAPVVSLPSATPSVSASLEMTMESVDEALNEVRPYLIADGGNVAVKGVNAETKTVYLQLEGACGSCPSSTVTMQMGVERVLKENFGPEVRVEQVDDGPAVPTSLTLDMVEDEVNRIKPAILAMGGVVRIVSVDADTGVVQLNFRGASRVQQGLELAIRDLPLVNAVQFVMGDE